MLAVDFLQWWYSRGWGRFSKMLLDKLRGMADFFSITLLIRTLFAPFRQISSQDVTEGGPAAYIANFFDKLLSRVIGMIVRLMILIFGMITIVIEAVLSLALVIVWPTIPLMPVACVVLCIMGVTL
jgi:hypothetical protein